MARKGAPCSGGDDTGLERLASHTSSLRRGCSEVLREWDGFDRERKRLASLIIESLGRHYLTHCALSGTQKSGKGKQQLGNHRSGLFGIGLESRASHIASLWGAKVRLVSLTYGWFRKRSLGRGSQWKARDIHTASLGEQKNGPARRRGDCLGEFGPGADRSGKFSPGSAGKHHGVLTPPRSF